MMEGGEEHLSSIYRPGSTLSLHLPSLPLQLQIGQHFRISCFLSAVQMFSLRHEWDGGPAFCSELSGVFGHAHTQWLGVGIVCSFLSRKESI